MPPPAILDPLQLDFSRLLADREAIQRVNPHRYEFALLDGVLMVDRERALLAGYHEIRSDAFWVRGHIPGRPLFPGVLMIESCAQLASYAYYYSFPGQGFLGFAGADGVKFRGTVEPPTRFVIIGRLKQLRPRRLICDMQGFVGSTLVVEAEITGMPV